MSRLSNEQFEKGRTRFLAEYPEIKARIDSITQEEAEALGIALMDLRESETMRELCEIAHFKNADSMRLLWRYIADTDAEFAQMIERQDAAVKQALGL